MPQRITLCPFPPLHWFLHARGPVVVDLHEHYVKQSYRNRYHILGVNGPMMLTLPVEGQKGMKIPMRDIRLAGGRWREQQLGSIRAAYGRAAFFEHYYDGLEAVLMAPYTHLCDFSLASLEWVKKSGVAVEYTLSESAEQPAPEMIAEFEPVYRPPVFPVYSQVFADRFGFVSGLSVVDLLMNTGPRAAGLVEGYRG